MYLRSFVQFAINPIKHQHKARGKPKMAKLINQREIKKYFDVAEDEYLKFNATDGPLISWNGRNVKAISQNLFDTLVSLCKLSSAPSEDVHEKSRESILAIDEFARAFLDFQTRSAAFDATCHPAGTQEMWNAFYLIRRSIFDPVEFRPLESIDILLNKQRVSIQQIALIYGFLLKDGTPEIHKVEEELLEPGKHTGGDWLPPVEKKYREELGKRWSKRIPCDDFLDYGEQPKGKGKKIRVEAPESLETLIQQRVSVAQILEMKPNLNREEVELTAAQMGIALPDANYHRPDANTAEQAETGIRRPPVGAGPALTNSASESDPPPGGDASDVKKAAAFVRNLKSQGKSAEEIATKVSQKFPGVDVSGILG
jgi:hypothetical protein